MAGMFSSAPTVVGADAELAHAAAQKVVDVHKRLVDFLAVGQTLAQIDAFVGRTLDELGCKSCFFRYTPERRMPPFPSQACLSLNDCIVHGTAGYTSQKIAPGDVLSIDVGVRYKGWIGDAAWTYAFGHASPEVRKLMAAGRESLTRGIRALSPEGTWSDWARAVQTHVELEQGLHLVRGLGGHGYGRRLHAPPYVSNVLPTRADEWPDGNRRCRPGTLVALEPMIAWGTAATRQADRTWPIFTADGSPSVHYEHDVLMTPDGPRVLTHGLDDLPDIIER